MENIVEVRNLQKAYKNKVVLKDLNLSIAKGSIFALLGSNGAGKTTTVNILSTLSKPDDGHATICGFDVVKEGNGVRQNISLTGQFAAVDEALTGRENLKLIGQLKRLPNLTVQVKEWLKDFRLEEAADKPVSTYSGGMRRRLDIAMSLMGNPKVLFLDEPTTGLDPQNRLAMWEMVKDLVQKGTTVFLTTQYMEEAEFLADEIAILHEGRIIARGSSGELKEIVEEEEGLADMSLEDVFLYLIGEKKGDMKNV